METTIIGCDRPLVIGSIQHNISIRTHDAKDLIKVTYKVLREATRVEWEAVITVGYDSPRAARGYFYEILPLD